MFIASHFVLVLLDSLSFWLFLASIQGWCRMVKPIYFPR